MLHLAEITLPAHLFIQKPLLKHCLLLLQSNNLLVVTTLRLFECLSLGLKLSLDLLLCLADASRSL